jgi:hypothetical protein
VLYLDGREVQGVVAIGSDLDGQTLQFRLHRNSDNDEIWADLLGKPSVVRSERFLNRPVEVSVGLENDNAAPTAIKGDKFMLARIQGWQFLICSLIVIGLAIAFWRLARTTDILRDVGPKPPSGVKKPYSLARFQMAVWFFLVITSFLYIWVVTGAHDTINESVLGLIGIGAGAALGAAAIDVNKRAETANKVSALTTEIAALDQKIQATPAPPDLAALQQEKTAKEDEREAATPRTAGFLNDLLTDADGHTFHRFQMFVWTVVLGLLFLISVWQRLSMPEFSATLLALLGISAGTYLGFKIPENQG